MFFFSFLSNAQNSGHAYQHELLLYTENCFTILKNIFTNSSTTAERVAILYLMYAVYFKQPTNNFCKFRFTPNDWTKMKQFYDSISVDAKYLQVRTIFWRLWQQNAFRFVDCDREYYPETMQFHCLENDGLKNFHKINATMIGHVNDVQNTSKGLLSAIGTLQMGYNEMKEHFAATQNECIELQSIDVISDINKHMVNIRKLFQSKFDGNKKHRKAPNAKTKAIDRLLLAGPSSSNAMQEEQNSDLDSDLNESNEDSTHSENDCDEYDGNVGDDDDSTIDDNDDDDDECLNIGRKRYYLKRKAERNVVGELHTLKSSMFSSNAKSSTKTTKKMSTTTATPSPTIESIDSNWLDHQSTMTETSIEQTPLSIDDIDGKIVISHPKKVYNRYSKEYRSSVRKQFIDCPEYVRYIE